MRISGLCLLMSALALAMAEFARGSQRTVSMLVLVSVAVSCLGTLELKIHRRTRSSQRRNASTLASALRKGALR